METLYPVGPTGVPPDLAAPNARYRRHAWLAMLALAGFVLIYIALACWFSLLAYHQFASLASAADDSIMTVVYGFSSAFLAVFMWKALFFVRPGGKMDGIEVTATDQPHLFAFLQRLADEAGAPRPHRVFLSLRVNAAVFYDLSILNFLFPSRKNLEIGLGLVNVLTLSELKAVLAHEFGHFAQRSMAVGRWVYIAQQIAEQIVWRRDRLDDFLVGLSRIDLRIAWIGWLLRLVVWSIRSLLETLFRAVMLAQRALSREMEMQADLVAVSLTGSDALIHALHKAQAADDAWDRTLSFADSELRNGNKVVDLFALQTQVLAHLRAINGDPDYGLTPPVPNQHPETHRVFRAEIAHPPRMWQTHPHNHEREENAKRHYITVAGDDRPAWDIFSDAEALRRSASLDPVAGTPAEEMAIEASLDRLERLFSIESLQPRYRGAYLGRSMVRDAGNVADLYAPTSTGSEQALAELYPESLAHTLEQWRSTQKEIELLERVQRGEFAPPGGIVHHRDCEVRREDLPRTIAALQEEQQALREQVVEHDRRCRAEHVSAAESVGEGWSDYLKGLLALLHYADHGVADLRDAQQYLAHEYRLVTVSGKLGSSGRTRLLAACKQMQVALRSAFAAPVHVYLDQKIAERVAVANWADAFETFKLLAPTSESLGDWLSVVDGWVDSAANALSGLAYQARELLLETELQVATARREGKPLPPAPAQSKVDGPYPTLCHGQERKLDPRLHWWDRFQVADGWIAAGARMLVALLIVGAVLGFSSGLTFAVAGGKPTLMIYNGFATDIVVWVGTDQVRLAPHGTRSLRLAPETLTLVARTGEGGSIESFNATIERTNATYVYNVAGAAPLVEWTATYGNATESPERLLGTRRWGTSSAQVLFKDPPESMRTRSGGTRRTVLTGFGDMSPFHVLDLVSDPSERADMVGKRVRWDATNSRHYLDWIQLAAAEGQLQELLDHRLAESPGDIVLRRIQQDHAGEYRAGLCEADRADAAASPADADMAYLAARCMADHDERRQAFLDGHARWPAHPWFALAAGYSFADEAQWDAAARALDLAHLQLEPLADRLAVEIVRIERAAGAAPSATRLRQLAEDSPRLAWFLEQERLHSVRALHSEGAERALSAATMNGERDSLLWLAAASIDISPAIVTEALATEPSQSVHFSSVGAALGLALRERRNTEPYFDIVDTIHGEEQGAILREFVRHIGPAVDGVKAEAALKGARPEVRGHAYVIALVSGAGNLPEHWRRDAERLLFAFERPRL